MTSQGRPKRALPKLKRADTMNRCRWVNVENPLYVSYHDKEWGRPLHDDCKLYEMLLLECFQAGLSWECILNKREHFRKAFSDFDPAAVAAYGEADVRRLMADKGIIRNRAKIMAGIANSRVFLDIQQEWGSFDRYLWHFTKDAVVVEPYTERTTSPLSDVVSADLKRRGMKFVGSVTIYSYLQAVGVINGHGPECSLYEGELG